MASGARTTSPDQAMYARSDYARGYFAGVERPLWGSLQSRSRRPLLADFGRSQQDETFRSGLRWRRAGRTAALCPCGDRRRFRETSLDLFVDVGGRRPAGGSRPSSVVEAVQIAAVRASVAALRLMHGARLDPQCICRRFWPRRIRRIGSRTRRRLTQNDPKRKVATPLTATEGNAVVNSTTSFQARSISSSAQEFRISFGRITESYAR